MCCGKAWKVCSSRPSDLPPLHSPGSQSSPTWTSSWKIFHFGDKLMMGDSFHSFPPKIASLKPSWVSSSSVKIKNGLSCASAPYLKTLSQRDSRRFTKTTTRLGGEGKVPIKNRYNVHGSSLGLRRKIDVFPYRKHWQIIQFRFK